MYDPNFFLSIAGFSGRTCSS